MTTRRCSGNAFIFSTSVAIDEYVFCVQSGISFSHDTVLHAFPTIDITCGDEILSLGPKFTVIKSATPSPLSNFKRF